MTAFAAPPDALDDLVRNALRLRRRANEALAQLSCAEATQSGQEARLRREFAEDRDTLLGMVASMTDVQRDAYYVATRGGVEKESP